MADVILVSVPVQIGAFYWDFFGFGIGSRGTGIGTKA